MNQKQNDQMAEYIENIQGKLVSKKHWNYNVRLEDDKYDCFISGMALTLDGRRLLIDRYNYKVKMFSRDMKVISSLSLSSQPWDITVTRDKEAVVSVPFEPKLLILKVTRKRMSIRESMKLFFRVYGLATYKDKILVTSRFPTPSVKLIDQSGKIYWSTSNDQLGQNSRPEYVTCYDGGKSSTVIVTDFVNDTLTLLNTNTGDVISRRQVKKKALCGVTTDNVGNIYFCYFWRRDLTMLPRDFSEESIFLNVHDGVGLYPQAITYDVEDHQLLVTYHGNDLDCFQLMHKVFPVKECRKDMEYGVQLSNDKKDCNITGMVVTLDGRRLLADNYNNKIKMFSRDMKIISSLSLPAEPFDIAVTGDKAVDSVPWESTLLILNVSDKQMSINQTVELYFRVDGIATNKDKLVVTSLSPFPPSVKLIDLSGKVYWSTSTDQKGHQLFVMPVYVTFYDGGRSSTVIVTDRSNDTLTLLNSDSGEVISRHQGKGPHGVTVDTAGNVFVFYWGSGEVVVLSKDLSDEKILLNLRDDPKMAPQAIVYDVEDHQLLVANGFGCNVLDCFQVL